MIRVGLAGTGSMGLTHAQAFATIPGVVVAAVLDIDRDRAVQLAATVGAHPYSDLDAMLEAEKLDVVDCCLPTAQHRITVKQAAQYGCHVICEKPLTLTVADGQAMIAATRAAGTQLLVGQVVRFFPEYQRIASALREGRIGTPVSLTMLRQGSSPGGSRSWYLDETQSGGIFLDMMIHDFDWALHHLGPAERVYARLVQRFEPRAFTQGMATIRHTSGALSQITGTWGHPGPFTTMVELAGDGGLLQHNSSESTPIILYAETAPREPGDVPLPDLSVTNPYRVELAHFVDVLAGRAESLVRPEEALAALSLALSARASAATNQAQVVEVVAA
jgi:UDP-N-acetylglucosamine 3-dehydrogenase